MTDLSKTLRELAHKGLACPKARQELADLLVFHQETMIAALELQERVNAPETVEAVARALCAHDGANWNAPSFGETPDGQEPDEMRDTFRSQSLAAIATMKGDQ